MNKTIEALRKYWAGLGILNPKGATAAELKEFELRHKVVLTPFLREYFELINGTKEGEVNCEDEELTSFWHLDQIVSFSEWAKDWKTAPAGESYFVFADHSINVHCWAVRLSPDKTDPNPVIVSYKPLKPLTDSFEEFLKRYIEREQEVLYPTP